MWTAVMFALLLLEIKSVYQDRNEHDNEQRESRERSEQNFQAIANGLRSAISQGAEQFNATMRRSDAIIGGVTDSIKTQTGGDSFAYIAFTPEPGGVSLGGLPISSAAQFLVSITSRGKYPLRETHCTLMDDERRLQAVLEYNKLPSGNWMDAITSADTPYYIPYLHPQSKEAPTGEVKVLGWYPFGAKDANDMTVGCSSLNGFWTERLHLRKINGKWHQSLSILGPTLAQSLHPFVYSNSDFPEGKAIAEKDWPRPKPKAH